MKCDLPAVFENKISNQTHTQITTCPEIINVHLSDNSLIQFNKNLFLKIKPEFINQSKRSIPEISLPYGVSKKDIEIFINLSNNHDNTNSVEKNIVINNRERLVNFLNLLTFFNNEELSVRLLSEVVLNNINEEIYIDLFIFSYKKLNYYSQNGKTVHKIYFDLFYQLLKEISKNFYLILNNINRIKKLDKKIINELLQNTFKYLILENYVIASENDINLSARSSTSILNNNSMNIINEDICIINTNENKENNNIIKQSKNSLKNNKKIKINELKELITFLIDINNCKNFYELLSMEYKSLLSPEIINELKEMPNPLFIIDIPFSLYENYCEEFPIKTEINNKTVNIVIFYKSGDNSFNVTLELIENYFTNNKIEENNHLMKLFTLLTYVQITIGENRIEINSANKLTFLSNNKCNYLIFKMNNFDNELKKYFGENNKFNFFSVSIKIKICYLYSALVSYLLFDYPRFINDKNINKIPKKLLFLIVKNKNLNRKTDNYILKSILLWLDDEINIKEDITELFPIINWNNINISLIFEFIIKYSHFIINNQKCENIFISILENKYNNAPFITSLMKHFFAGVERVDYNDIYSKMKKNEKYKYLGLELEKNNENNIFNEKFNSFISKDTISLNEDIQNIFKKYNNVQKDFNKKKYSKNKDIKINNNHQRDLTYTNINKSKRNNIFKINLKNKNNNIWSHFNYIFIDENKNKQKINYKRFYENKSKTNTNSCTYMKSPNKKNEIKKIINDKENRDNLDKINKTFLSNLGKIKRYKKINSKNKEKNDKKRFNNINIRKRITTDSTSFNIDNQTEKSNHIQNKNHSNINLFAENIKIYNKNNIRYNRNLSFLCKTKK